MTDIQQGEFLKCIGSIFLATEYRNIVEVEDGMRGFVFARSRAPVLDKCKIYVRRQGFKWRTSHRPC
jgi:hypothetical protein